MKSQAPGSPEELRCLQMLNQQLEGSSLEELSSSQGCLKLASTIKAYVATVTENIIRRNAVKEAWQNYFNTSEGQLPSKTSGKASAHLTLRPQSLAQDGEWRNPSETAGSPNGNRGEIKGTGMVGERFTPNWDRARATPSPGCDPARSPQLLSLPTGPSQHSWNLSQSCRHALTHWGHSSLQSHVHNMSYRAGRLRVQQPGKYYVYSQIYFRYRGAGRHSGPQLVQCIQWQPAHSPPVLLLKGVGTKCWAPEAEYGLHALYQGGLFELKEGDELFVSVSSLAIDSNDAAASYFGAFRLDL
ncbi:hypothetical protein IHE44_0003012 [Lamprotornis superbus]|uniref:THD domain-containing protein n=1 Tax=Lamprotornis superbus TaxID=245042 RepID=A0A835NDU0_9PASS|nr:hypothetical protein IHE44_0003012 [Lamprotornis superbus]